MRKSVYFDVFDRRGWPSPSQLEHYFLTSSGRQRFFESGNDSWGLRADGAEGTDHLPAGKGRIDIDLTILGHPDLGILLFYKKSGGGRFESHFSKGDLTRLREWVKTMHSDLMPIGLFIPFEAAWKAVKEFIETDGALPKSIEWVAGNDLPAGTFPTP